MSVDLQTVVADPAAAERAAIRRTRAGTRTRRITIGVVLAAAVALVGAVALSVGESVISLPDVLSTLAGQGSRNTNYVILELRLPRAVTAILVGIGFGLSGTVIQSLLGNPLASPDVIGLSTGASAAAVLGIVVIGLDGIAVSVIALFGALLTAAVMYVLAWRDGVSGYRLILIGIGLAALLLSVVSFFMTRAQVTSASEALVWISGSLSGRNWSQAVPLAVALAVLVPVLAVLSRVLGLLGMGDDTARGLGVPVQQTRLALLIVAVAIAGVATAATGPIAFVALLAGPIGRTLSRDGGAALLPSALVGALIVLIADFAAQHTPGLPLLPVGVLTGAIGAPYLLFLLATMNRAGRGG
ncbi:iron complex transport system permease protein [Pseudonocardia ammonioxydans]|uniref:Iron complex transport system permease protein n=1 Tax=Pseudonocardia ammonioxydans TaxID=260086 RepID=A0A1I5FLU4_PSUAM|nr:iron chelate uptake ABC transporter family permease subunit [Pseudonocardia ammonioxydans]SFO24730.1 iron complex transport system permease protein [Pseudonocardia ammonioxydans]